jgi:hypothetical protein
MGDGSRAEAGRPEIADAIDPKQWNSKDFQWLFEHELFKFLRVESIQLRV